MGAPLHFGILGPLEVQRDGTRVSVGGPRQRALLALLLCNANRVVSRDRLIDELRPDRSTASADAMLRVQISRLRKVLRDDDEIEPRVIARPPGYVLVIWDGELDLHKFEELVREGRQAAERDDPGEAALLLCEAEKLWRGRPLADLEFEPFARVEVQRLEELRLMAVEERIDADLALGRHATLCPELEALAVEHPLRERFLAQLMLALYRSGRQAEALDAYRRARTRLSDELGLEPGPRLRTLQTQILNQEPSLTPADTALGPPRADAGRKPAADAVAAPPATQALRHALGPTAPSGGPETLVEREADLHALERLLASVVASGAGRLALVAGEAGIGKTALVCRFCECQAQSTRVLWGACEPLLTPRPLGAIVEIAEATGGEVEQLVDAGARPYEVAAALVRELRTWIPTVLVLEDLHWADEATLDVLRLFGRRVASVPTLVVATFRDDELDRSRQLRIVLGELPGRPARLKVAPLSLEAVTEMAGPRGVDARHLYTTTGGNPFFVTEVLAGGGEQIPETVRDAVLARAMRLSEPAVSLLQAVAVIPGAAELWLLTVVAGELIGQMDACLASGMLVEVHGGVAFRHELARLAVEQSLGPGRRRSLHQAAFTALASPPVGVPDPGRLAHHAEAVADRDAVLRWAPEAAELAALAGAHREAKAHYGHALRFAGNVGAGSHADLLEHYAFECFLTNEFDHAIVGLKRALAIRRELGDQRRVGNVLCSLARVVHKSGRSHDAQVMATDAVGLLEPLGPTKELARSYATRAQLAMVLDELDETLAWGESAIQLAERLDDIETLASALNSVGCAMMDFNLPGGEDRLERSLRLAQQAGFDGEAARAFSNLVCTGPISRQYRLAESYLNEGIAYCNDRGLDLYSQQLRVLGVLLDLGRGRWQQAVDTGTRLLQHPTRTPHLRLGVLQTVGIVRARRGEPGTWEALDEALHIAASTGELQSIGPVVASRAEALWLEGRETEIHDETQAAFELALRKGQPWYLGEVAYWRWRAGAPHETPAGAVAEPYALSIAGEWGRAAEECRKLGCPYEAALALSDGDDADALSQSVAELRALGARRTAGIIARRLRASGPTARIPVNPAGSNRR